MRIKLWYLIQCFLLEINYHYNDVIMTPMASQITSLTVVYSTVYSDGDQRKHQSSASLAFVRGIHRDRWISRTKGQLRGKCFHLMSSSCFAKINIPVRLHTSPFPLCHLRATSTCEASMIEYIETRFATFGHLTPRKTIFNAFAMGVLKFIWYQNL